MPKKMHPSRRCRFFPNTLNSFRSPPTPSLKKKFNFKVWQRERKTLFPHQVATPSWPFLYFLRKHLTTLVTNSPLEAQQAVVESSKRKSLSVAILRIELMYSCSILLPEHFFSCVPGSPECCCCFEWASSFLFGWLNVDIELTWKKMLNIVFVPDIFRTRNTFDVAKRNPRFDLFDFEIFCQPFASLAISRVLAATD